jgi:2-amino-4-hydroxy-6-hydroxymethyldihydropteridine diphosphokinase
MAVNPANAPGGGANPRPVQPVTNPLREPVSACVALGANLGEPAQAVQHALAQLGHIAHTQLVSASSLYETAPHEAQGPLYVNAVAHLETQLNAVDLLLALQALEQAAGRVRSVQNAPRTLDLDLLFYGDACIQSAWLTVPHPRWRERAFVLRPLQDVAGHLVSEGMLAAVADQPIRRL